MAISPGLMLLRDGDFEQEVSISIAQEGDVERWVAKRRWKALRDLKLNKPRSTRELVRTDHSSSRVSFLLNQESKVGIDMMAEGQLLSNREARTK